jgi:hypothetical protein
MKDFMEDIIADGGRDSLSIRRIFSNRAKRLGDDAAVTNRDAESREKDVSPQMDTDEHG